MKRFLIPALLFTLQLVLAGFILADNVSQPPLQLVPGSGVQSQKGQLTPLPPAALPGQGAGAGGEEQLRDIHPPLPLPEESDYTIFAAGLLLLLLLFGLISWFFRYRRKKEKIAAVPPHETALAELLDLRTSMTDEQALYYARELADILRRYIEKRFRIRTSRQTTKEFFASLAENPGHLSEPLGEHHERLKNCLEVCDMAKFAHCPPDLHSMKKMETGVQEFIEVSRQKREGGK